MISSFIFAFNFLGLITLNKSLANPTVFNSRPGGAKVEIHGYHSIFGRTPLNVTHSLNGVYQIKITKEGFEDWKKQVLFAPGLNNSFNISLVPKTRWRAGFYSILFPGWGQLYSERPIKGLIITSAFWTSLGITAYTSFNYNRRVDSYENAVSGLNNSNLTNQEYAQRWETVLSERRKVDNAFKLRKQWIWLTTAIFTYNVVDAVLMFPNFNQKQNKLLFSVLPSPLNPELALTIHF